MFVPCSISLHIASYFKLYSPSIKPYQVARVLAKCGYDLSFPEDLIRTLVGHRSLPGGNHFLHEELMQVLFRLLRPLVHVGGEPFYLRNGTRGDILLLLELSLVGLVQVFEINRHIIYND